MKLNYQKIWKRKTIPDKILAFIIGNKQKINCSLYRFKKHYWYRLINRIQMIGVSKENKIWIIRCRQQYHQKAKTIAKENEISKKKVLAILYYYNCWKIKSWMDLYFMRITGENYWLY